MTSPIDSTPNQTVANGSLAPADHAPFADIEGALDEESTAGPPRRLRSPARPDAALPPRIKAAQDTSLGCRERSAADLLESVTMTTANGRLRLESSAASWTLRADMLGRLEQKAERRAKSPTDNAEENDPWL